MSNIIEGKDIDSDDRAFLYLNLHPNETIELIVRHHWFGFVSTLLIFLAMGAFPTILVWIISVALRGAIEPFMQIIIIAFSGYFVFILTFLFGSWINYYYDIIFITNERIINVAQEGLLARKTSELSLHEVQDVSAEVNGFFRTFFNYGLLVIETAGQGTHDRPGPGMHGYFTIEDIPDPNRVARIILELHRELDRVEEHENTFTH